MKKNILTPALILLVSTVSFAQQSPKDRFSEGKPVKVSLDKVILERGQGSQTSPSEKHKFGVVPVKGRMIKPEARESMHSKM